MILEAIAIAVVVAALVAIAFARAWRRARQECEFWRRAYLDIVVTLASKAAMDAAATRSEINDLVDEFADSLAEQQHESVLGTLQPAQKRAFSQMLRDHLNTTKEKP